MMSFADQGGQEPNVCSWVEKRVIVRTKPELDQAIANTQARQIVVDGDSELLSYAEHVVNPQSENISGATWEFGAYRLTVSEEKAPPLSDLLDSNIEF